MKMKKLLCIASLMLMIFLVGCKKDEKLDIADLQYNWQFVEVETAGQIIPHTPGFESREPSVAFVDESITISINGKNFYNGVVEAADDCYNITFPGSSAKPMVATLSNDGNALTISAESLDAHFRFKKQ